LLHEPSKDRVAAGTVDGIGLVELFTGLAHEANDSGVGAMQMIVTYMEENDEFVAGTYVPELQLIVRRIDAD
jgi:hypothetical protein